MRQRMKLTSVFLMVMLFVEIPTSSLGFGMLKGGGGGGGSAVAEILAAGLITGLLMDNNKRSMPMLRSMAKPFWGAYSAMHPRHVMYPMMAARYPMMGSFIFPIIHRPHYMMNHAMMAQAAKDHAMMAQAAKDHAMMAQAAKDHAMMAQVAKDRQALASRLNDEIKALEAQESMLEVALERTREGADTAMTEMLNEEETAIPAAALLLETANLVASTPILENPPILPKDRQILASRLNEEIKALEAQESMLEAALERTRQGADTAITEMLNEEETAIPAEETAIPAAALLLETADLVDSTPVLENPSILPPPEMYQASSSEPESRYILPRIVRHFVQRLLRRGENN